MSTLASPVTKAPNACDAVNIEYTALPEAGSRLGAYAELAKPRIALMVLLSMGVGYVLGSAGIWQPGGFLNACVGIFLAVFSSSALNQYLERGTDARMQRTRSRPLPSGRLAPRNVLAAGLIAGVSAIAYLAWTVNTLTAVMTLMTIALYAAVYTPLKRYTSLCTAIGAIPGALPPVLGWTAAGAPLNWSAFGLFAILFVWQFPHFLAIAWIYREQYQAAGLKMIPGRERPGVLSLICTVYAVVLLPVSLIPYQLGLAGAAYGIVAILLGLLYLGSTVYFQREETRSGARRVLWASLVYLPCLLIALTWDHLRLLQ